MIDLPRSTAFGRRIPKTKFYENLSVSARLKRVFVEQIDHIEWRSKIAPSTINLAAGEHVNEIEVFLIKLNQRSLDAKVLSQIDKEIPYHILFLLEYDDEVQAWISYKEPVSAAARPKSGAFKPGVYYHTEWLAPEALDLRLNGLNMDKVYENLIRQIAGERLRTRDDADIREAVSRDERRRKLQKEIAALEKRVQNEKQFNRQVELNGRLKRLQVEYNALGAKTDDY